MFDERFVYPNDTGKWEVSEEELRYVNIHGVKTRRDVTGPFSATVKKNHREKYRKLKEKHDKRRNARDGQDEVTDSRNDCNFGSRHCTSQHVCENAMDRDGCDGQIQNASCDGMMGTDAAQITTGVVECTDVVECVDWHDNQEQDGPTCNVDGVINITDKVNTRRQSTGKKVYHMMNAGKVCTATGVRIKYRSKIHY